MNAQTLKEALLSGAFDASLTGLYGSEKLSYARERCIRVVDGYLEIFGDREEIRLFSSPGRVEITGNHTDHNRGLALAGAVGVDILAAVAKSGENVIRIKSEGREQDNVSLDNLSPREEEYTHSASLIRGVAADFAAKGREIGGFTAYTVSDVPKGSGLSSSAAFEVLTGCALNCLYNGGSVSPAEIARSAQYAENVYFGKPSGLLDQMACAVGNIVRLDFKDPEKVEVRPVKLDLQKAGYRLMIVSVGHGHADLTDEYASIPAEMKTVAALFGQEFLRGIRYEQLIEKAPEIREKCGDRAFLRAIHFVTENERVDTAARAIEEKNIPLFLEQLDASGDSSALCLQNIYPASDPAHQGVTVGLAAAKRLIGKDGACRIHGGGFGGTMLAILPEEKREMFTGVMEQLFGKGCCFPLVFREGAKELTI